jgi:TolA-binding protein
MRILVSTTSLAATLMLGGCAMRSDVHRVEDSLLRMEARQDSIRREILEQLRRDADQNRATVRELGGDLRVRMDATDRQIARLEELTGHAHQSVADLGRTLEKTVDQRLAERLAATPRAADDTQTATASPCPPAAEAEPILEATREIVRRRVPATGTAREGAGEYIRCFPNAAGVSEARLLLAETYALEGRLDEARTAMLKVIEHHRGSPHATTARYRLGMIELEAGRPDAARPHFEQVLAESPNAPEARAAREALSRAR